jgi:hypothetical protein
VQTPDIPPTSVVSAQGRRILVAVVTGEAGDRIQAWRERHDPRQARRLPPHTTLCYHAPVVDAELLEQQVRHAFATPVTVKLGAVREFDNEEHTFYVAVEQTAALDEARCRLYDGEHLMLARGGTWTWHVTCVHASVERNRDALREAARELRLGLPWRIDTVAYLELRGDVYESVATWRV